MNNTKEIFLCDLGTPLLVGTAVIILLINVFTFKINDEYISNYILCGQLVESTMKLLILYLHLTRFQIILSNQITFLIWLIIIK